MQGVGCHDHGPVGRTGLAIVAEEKRLNRRCQNAEAERERASGFASLRTSSLPAGDLASMTSARAESAAAAAQRRYRRSTRTAKTKLAPQKKAETEISPYD